MKHGELGGTWIKFTTPEGGASEVRLPARASLADVELAQAVLAVIKEHLIRAASTHPSADIESKEEDV